MSRTVDLPADEHSALIVGPSVLAEPTGPGALDGLSFVAKDVIDVAGQRTGAGNPDLLAAARPAAAHAWAVARLLNAGATCIGKAHTVETAYAMSGVNDHYGTPVNPAAPGRDPGGSSSGSAVAVAAGLADFALGTDTAGSVRVPASYCGVVGFRPTHGRVPVDGVFPLAPRLDTVGWFARTGDLARSIGEVLLAPSKSAGAPSHPSRLLVATDLFGQCDPGHGDQIAAVVERIGSTVGLPVIPVRFWGDDGPERWPEVFRTLQRFDAWRTHRAWIESARPRFGPSVAPRWEEAAAVTADQNAAAEELAAVLCRPAWELLSGGSVLIVPSAPGPAPRLGLPGGAAANPVAAGEPAPESRRAGLAGGAALAVQAATGAAAAATRARLMTLSVIAPILGAPEVSLPLLRFDDLPVGIGLMASPGCDELLLDLAATLA